MIFFFFIHLEQVNYGSNPLEQQAQPSLPNIVLFRCKNVNIVSCLQCVVEAIERKEGKKD